MMASLRRRTVGAVLVVASLASCTASDGREPADEPADATIEFWYQPNGLYPQELMAAELARFADERPDITVEATMVGWEQALTTFATATRSGAAPDVASLGSAWLADLNVDGSLYAFGPEEVAGFGGVDAFHGAMWQAGVDHEGRTIGIPWLTVPRLLFYRPSLLDAAGVDPASDLADWSSLEASLERLQDLDGVSPWGVAGRNDWNVVHTALAWIWAAGARPVGEDGELDLTSAATVQGLGELQRLVDVYGDRGALVGDDVALGYGLAGGTYAMAISGPWLARTLEAELPSDDWDAVPLPSGPGGSATLAGGSHLAVLADTEEPEAAMALVRFLTRRRSQERLAEATGLLPARLDATFDGREADAARDALSTAQPYPTVRGWLEVEHALQRSFSRMWANVEQGTPLDDAELASMLHEANLQVREALDGPDG